VIIKKMTAAFGRLDQDCLELGEGLNIIQAPNEGGKSTWAGFLKAMFYGISTRDRDKKGYLADKNRYQPWSGAPMEGELELEWGGRSITLRRFAKGGAPFIGFSAVYTGTGRSVPGLTGESCGELLLGVGREVYERSAFLGQGGGVGIDSAPELERRITTLVSSGEEDVSFSQAQGRLREWQRRRRHNHTGLIPRLEEELERVKGTLERMEQVNHRMVQTQAMQRELEQVRRELEGEEHIHQRLAQRDVNSRYAQALRDWEQARGQLERLEREQGKYHDVPDTQALRKAQGELQYIRVLEDEVRQLQGELEQAQEAVIQTKAAVESSHFAGMTGEEAKRRAQEDVEDCFQAEKRCRNLKRIAPLLLGCVAVLAVLMVLKPSFWGLLLAGAVVCAAAGGICLYLASRAEEEGHRLLQRYHVQDPEDIEAQAEDYMLCWQLTREKGEQVERTREILEQKKAQRERTEEQLLRFVQGFAPQTTGLFGCSAALSFALGMEDRLRECAGRLELARKRCDDLKAQGGEDFDTLEMLRPPEHTPEQTRKAIREADAALAAAARELARCQGELGALGDPAALDARREQLEGELERRNREYDALTLALAVLEGADVQMRERFSPQLERRAGAILSRLTGGRYDSVQLDREFDAAAAGPSQRLSRGALALSKGTRDQIYLAVRLAVCQLCLPEEDPAPLVLDDALVSFDDTRMALALDYLEGLGRQVLLFTCQSREGQYLRGRPGVKLLGPGQEGR